MNFPTESMLGIIEQRVRSLPTDWLGTLADLTEKLASGVGPEWLRELRKFLRKEPTRAKGNGGFQVLSKTPPIATLDLATTYRRPFGGAVVEKHIGEGTVTIEKRVDGRLYIDGKKVVLHISERQLVDMGLSGHELRAELDGKPVLNAAILDFLMANWDFFPNDWKRDARGKYLFVIFWGTIYRDPLDNCLHVRYIYGDDQECQTVFIRLDKKLVGSSPAACLEC